MAGGAALAAINITSRSALFQKTLKKPLKEKEKMGMYNLQIFDNEEFGQMRTVIINDEPWFCLTDICKALDLTQASKVKERLNEKGVNTIPTLTAGGTQSLLYINEPNLYKAIFQSRKESAECFTDWVTGEVLPAIRKTGAYSDQNIYKVKDTSLGEITSFVREMDKVMRDQNSHPSDIAEAFKEVCGQFGITLPKNFVRKPQVIETNYFLPLSEISDCD